MARQYRTLEDLRTELKAALGFGASGSGSAANNVLVDSHLRTAQKVLYDSHDWAHLRKWEDLALGSAQYLIDYPTTADQDRVQQLAVLRGGVWSPALKKGIQPQLYTYQDKPSWPQRWEPYEQIQIWPLSDQAYTLRCFFIRQLSRFTQDADRATLDDENILLVAKWTAKSHYRQPDAAIYKELGTALLLKLKGKSWGQTVFNPRDWTMEEPLVRPVTV